MSFYLISITRSTPPRKFCFLIASSGNSYQLLIFFVLCHEQIIFLMIPMSVEQAPDDYYRVCSRRYEELQKSSSLSRGNQEQ